MEKLVGKIVIEGILTAMSAIRVGGNKSSLEIGGIDNNVIKTGNGIPFIPGSSLKGKMRSLLARIEGSNKVDNDSNEIQKLFGWAGEATKGHLTRLQVKDLHLDVEKFKQEFKSEFLDFEFTEIKTENTIQRHKGSAQHPRQVERIPKGSEFKLKLILDLYEGDNHDWLLKQLALAFELIELDYVGGHGSKGSGEVKINLNKFETRFYGEGHAKLSEKEAGWKAIFNNFLLPN